MDGCVKRSQKRSSIMADQQTPEFSETDVQSLSQKLEQFSQTLTSGEQAALREVIERAMPEEDDVQGYAVKSRMANLYSVDTLSFVLKAFRPRRHGR
jgi:hypothetical protein